MVTKWTCNMLRLQNRRDYTIRHNDVQDSPGNVVTIICKDLEIEPKLLLETEEVFVYQNANTSNETRVDTGASGFWERGPQVFFDV